MGSAITTANCVYVPCLGNTALHWAFQHGHTELAYVLVRVYCAEVNIVNNQGCPPIHLAIQAGHYFMLELMWTSHSWPPAFYGRNHADLLHACGATVNKTALREYEGLQNSFTIYHLVAARAVEQNFKKYNDNNKMVDVNEHLTNQTGREGEMRELDMFFKIYCTQGRKKDQEVFEVLDHFLKHHSNMPSSLELPEDQKFGCLLHYFSALNDATVIGQLVCEPYNYPPDLVNAAGYTPLLVGLNNECWDAVLQLLEYDVDVKRLDPVRECTPFQLFIEWTEDMCCMKGKHIQIINKFLEKGNYF